MRSTARDWLADLALGGLIGGVIGGIVAVNFVIYAGIDGGYEASISEVFSESLFAGVATLIILLSGPVLGVVTARRLRRKRPTTKGE